MRSTFVSRLLVRWALEQSAIVYGTPQWTIDHPIDTMVRVVQRLRCDNWMQDKTMGFTAAVHVQLISSGWIMVAWVRKGPAAGWYVWPISCGDVTCTLVFGGVDNLNVGLLATNHSCSFRMRLLSVCRSCWLGALFHFVVASAADCYRLPCTGASESQVPIQSFAFQLNVDWMIAFSSLQLARL